jgi:hypothetical protein
MDENASQPIGDAEPIAPRQARKILKRIGALVGVAAGGVAAFAVLLAPTRLSGASRSARLLWQHRQNEISDSIKHETQPGQPAAQQPNTASGR